MDVDCSDVDSGKETEDLVTEKPNAQNKEKPGIIYLCMIVFRNCLYMPNYMTRLF